MLLIPSTSYRASDFLDAASRLDVEVVVGSDHQQVLERYSRGRALSLDFEPVEVAVSRIVEHALRYPFSAIVGTDEETTVLAAIASKALRLTHNPVCSVASANDKHRFRCALANAGMRSPWFKRVSLAEDPEITAKSVSYPCVVKPLNLSGSRGVIRADDERGFIDAWGRIAVMFEASR